MSGKWRFRWAGVTGSIMLAVASAQAQDGQSAFQDSLPSLSAPQLRMLVQASAAANETSERVLRGGFAAFRLYELEGQSSDADAARSLFERTLRQEPRSAWAHYGLGLVQASRARTRASMNSGGPGGVVTVQAFAGIFGADPRSRALREFRRALELDPVLVPAVVALADLALQSRAEAHLHEARNALVKAAQQVGDRRVWLKLANVETALGLGIAAQNAAEHLVRLDSTDMLARLALARALFLQEGKTLAASELYFSALSRSDSGQAELFFRDASYILTRDEIRRWRYLPNTERTGWLRRMWDVRAARSGVTVDERLGEHYRRLAQAEREYPRGAESGAPPIGSLVVEGLADLPFDDRGVLLIRHGRPRHVISTISNGFPPNQTWVYQQPDSGGYRLFNFLKYPGAVDYRLVAQLPPCDSSRHSSQDPQVRTGIMPFFDARWVEGVVRYYEDRGKYEPRFQQLAARCQSATLNHRPGRTLIDTATVNLDAAELSLDLQRTALQALETDSDRPDFEAEVPFLHRLYRLRGDHSVTDLTAAVLIPGDRISPAQSTSGQTVYPVGVSLILLDSTAENVTRLDTTLYFESARVLAREDFLRLHVTLKAPLGATLPYRLVVRDLGGARRGSVVSGTVRGQSMLESGLLMSDLIIAESDQGRFQRGAHGLALMPPHEIDADRPFVLYYEIYNLPAGSAYSAEVSFEPAAAGAWSAVRRLFGGRKGVRLKFDGRTESAALGQVLHRISSELPAGEYRLRVTVTDNDRQQRATRETRLVILPRTAHRTRTEPVSKQN